MALPLEVVIIGAGMRGRDTFGRYALEHPERMRVVAVAEPDGAKRDRFAREHDLAPEAVFEDWRGLPAKRPLARAAIIATSDDAHTEPALTALRAGYHVLLEKPIAMRLADCEAVVHAAENGDRILQIGHVLRYTPFYRAVHRIAVKEARLGAIQTISMAEHVAHWHFTHSFVRGRWRTTRTAAPFLLAKCCHDLDLMSWLVGRPCRRVASFGERAHYRPERAPEGATARCLDGCPAEPECLHSAPRFYARNVDLWPWSDVTHEPDAEARREALRTGPYGVCVYRADNDVVDRQTVLLEFEEGVLGSFLAQGFAARPERTLRIQGTRGELRGAFERGEIELWYPGRLEPESVTTYASLFGHGGGDTGLLDHFTDVVAREAREEVLASGSAALESHRIGFAAEIARREGRVVALAELQTS
jgi:predicted dehydrogenase